jgi:hypothetical protein
VPHWLCFCGEICVAVVVRFHAELRVLFFFLSPRPRGYFGGLVAVRAAVHLYIFHAVKSLPVLSHALYLRPETWNSIPPVTLIN